MALMINIDVKVYETFLISPIYQLIFTRIYKKKGIKKMVEKHLCYTR